MSAPVVLGEVIYPDSDGKSMSDNTLQFDWIAILKWGAEAYFRDDPDVFVAGDHLIYPEEGHPEIRIAPDVYVAFGRPKGYRGSYRVFQESGLFPQVIFEVWSPNNTLAEMEEKRKFYEKYGAEEYYLVFPETPADAQGWRRVGDRLDQIPEMNGFVSPRLGFRFVLEGGDLTVYGPDNRSLLRPDEVAAELTTERERGDRENQRAEQEKQRAEQEKQRAENEKQRAENEKQRAEQQKHLAEQATQRAEQATQRAEQEKQRAEKLAAKLRELGVDPDAS